MFNNTTIFKHFQSRDHIMTSLSIRSIRQYEDCYWRIYWQKHNTRVTDDERTCILLFRQVSQLSVNYGLFIIISSRTKKTETFYRNTSSFKFPCTADNATDLLQVVNFTSLLRLVATNKLVNFINLQQVC